MTGHDASFFHVFPFCSTARWTPSAWRSPPFPARLLLLLDPPAAVTREESERTSGRGPRPRPVQAQDARRGCATADAAAGADAARTGAAPGAEPRGKGASECGRNNLSGDHLPPPPHGPPAPSREGPLRPLPLFPLNGSYRPRPSVGVRVFRPNLRPGGEKSGFLWLVEREKSKASGLSTHRRTPPCPGDVRFHWSRRKDGECAKL